MKLQGQNLTFPQWLLMKRNKNLFLPNAALGTNVTKDTTGFSAAHATLSSVTEVPNPKIGKRSLKAVFGAGGVWPNVFITDVAVSPSKQLTTILRLRGNANITVRLGEYTSGGSGVGNTNSSNITLTENWVDIPVTRAFGSTGRIARISIESQTAAQEGAIVYNAKSILRYGGS